MSRKRNNQWRSRAHSFDESRCRKLGRLVAVGEKGPRDEENVRRHNERQGRRVRGRRQRGELAVAARQFSLDLGCTFDSFDWAIEYR